MLNLMEAVEYRRIQMNFGWSNSKAMSNEHWTVLNLEKATWTYLQSQQLARGWLLVWMPWEAVAPKNHGPSLEPQNFRGAEESS